jgi:hypothetical protein
VNLLFNKSATKYALSFLKKKGYRWNNINYINNGRYCLVFGSENIAIIFKKAWFETFGDRGWENKDGCLETGIGDSVNVEDLKTMVANNIQTIYTVYKDGKIYKIPLHEFLICSHKWVNKEGKEVRSISIHKYIRVNEE